MGYFISNFILFRNVITTLLFLFVTLFIPKNVYSSQSIVIETNSVSIRNKPYLDSHYSKVIGNAQKGKKYTLVSEQTYVVFANPVGKISYLGGTWYQVKLPDGNLGWIAGSLRFRYRDLGWYTRKSKSRSPSQIKIKTFSHKIAIPNQFHASKANTNKKNRGFSSYFFGSLLPFLFFIALLWPWLPGAIGVVSGIYLGQIGQGDSGITVALLGIIINIPWYFYWNNQAGETSSDNDTPVQQTNRPSPSKQSSTKRGQSRGSWSEQRRGLFGDRYTQHYRRNGQKAGYSEERSDIFGNSYTQHYNQDDKKSNYSENRTGVFGDSYTQHHDESDRKIGYSEDRTGLFGDSYTQHYDKSGSKSGYSEKKTDILGSEYWQHYNQDGSKKD